MKRKIRSLVALVFVFSLIFSQFSVKEAGAEESGVPNEEGTLTIGNPVDGEFAASETVHWYKVDPSEREIADYTHLRVKLQSESEVNVTIYSSLENAIDNRAFDRYMSYSYENEPAIIDFPISWVGPYYIKIESYGMEEEYAEFDEEMDDMVTPYTISYDGVTLPPSDEAIAEECPAELSTKERENGKSILRDLRTVRETVLAKTENGQDLSALYYKAAPFISSKMVFSKGLRDDVYRDLVQLKDLFADVATNGSASSYTITKEDQKAINDLYNHALESTPDFIQEKIASTAKNVGISNLTSKTVSSILAKAGLSPVKSAGEETRLIVKLKDKKAAATIQGKTKSMDVESVSPLKSKDAFFSNMYVVEGKASAASVQAASKEISQLDEVEFVEPVQQYKALSTDAQYPYQWSLDNKGDNGGTPDADIQYEELQELLKDKTLKDTVIAVVDTGVDHTLADLSNVVLKEDGYNFVGRNSDAMDDHGHGTHVSGIIAAEANNHYSMAGINPHAKILPVKVLDASGSGDTEQIAYGIKYAVDHGAQVINLSLGGSYSRVIEYALKYAHDHGVTVVAATGNDGMEGISYPGSSKYVVSVGATNNMDLVSDYSNFGNGIDLVAPGTDIPSLVPDGNVTYMSGTSMATPHVAAVAGLLLSQDAGLTPAQVERVLTRTALDISFSEEDNPGDGYYYEDEYPYPAEMVLPGYDTVSGWGRLDALGAVTGIAQANIGTERIFGSDRYETAVKISSKGWEQSDVAVIATGRNYPDALSATPLAYHHQAPLLLTNTTTLPKSVKDELKRLKVKKVILVGGKSVISANVEKEVKDLGIKTVSRISGADRYETSVKIAEQLGFTDRAVVATGQSFADALSIAPIAARLEMPILLTSKNGTPDSVQNYIEESMFEQFYVIGGESVIPEMVAEEFMNYERLSGSDRYETNSSIISYFAGELNITTPFIATGKNYPDALAGSALAAVEGNPVVLTHPKEAQFTTMDTLAMFAPVTDQYYILGGEGAISDSVIESLLAQ
ncbi:cell wall-binding repeat-containing protein [Rossellomorea vietnamensis]|uniref:Cell wall-binding repeat-containing protein n=1 Tax=Rossellomorea vietnamensis TaxID=218284 RepID=A0ACD4C488_9BACI|nr:cell wall-binding repeat-containing protein [Rossellomorea vietnamensis]UXH43348.1 cell wall-binding repeat-containing protein [Rossellomorea vietnamensis]